MPENTFERGTQVAYVPVSAKGDIGHKDVSFGFVTSTASKIGKVFCRFYLPGTLILRTLGNSEFCDTKYLVKHESATPEHVQYLLEEYC